MLYGHACIHLMYKRCRFARKLDNVHQMLCVAITTQQLSIWVHHLEITKPHHAGLKRQRAQTSSQAMMPTGRGCCLHNCASLPLPKCSAPLHCLCCMAMHAPHAQGLPLWAHRILYILHHAWPWKQLSNFDSDLISADHTSKRDPTSSSVELHQLFAFLQGKAWPALQLAG
jgi:hypothetical protein